MAALRDLTVSAGERVELSDADRERALSLAWLCDPDVPWEVAQVVTRSDGMWWATNGVAAAVVPADDGDDLTVTVTGDEVTRSDVIPRSPKAFAGLCCGLRRWCVATVDRDELVAAAAEFAAGERTPVTDVLAKCRRRGAGTSAPEVPAIDASLLAELAGHAPEGRLSVHHRGATEPVIVTGAGSWRGVLAAIRPAG